MDNQDPVQISPGPRHHCSDRSVITGYEMAVLSTLIDENDSSKVVELAQQWGYQQEFLKSVWREMRHPTTHQRG